jgi:hypothetical protein
MKLPLAFSAPLIQDLRASRAGQFSPLTSQTFERIGQFGLRELPSIVGALVRQGKLPAEYPNLVPALAGTPDFVAFAASQFGRGKLAPTVDDWTRLLDGLAKTAWAIYGATLGASIGGALGGPEGARLGALKGAQIASTAAGLTADLVRTWTASTFQELAHLPVLKQMVDNWVAHVASANAHGVRPRSFTEMFPEALANPAFDRSTVLQIDSLTTQAIQTTGATSQKLSASALSLPQREPSWKREAAWNKVSFWPPPCPPEKCGGGGGAAIGSSSSIKLAGPPPPPQGGGALFSSADVVKAAAAHRDKSSAGVSALVQQQGFVTPFLLFCRPAQ